MLKICPIIFCLVFISTTIVYSQGKIAKTADGQIIILKKDGTWHVPNDIDLHANKAVTEDGELVLLGRDGKWFLTKSIVTSPAQQRESNQNSEKGSITTGDIFTIPYASTLAAGNACVHEPASMKNNYAKPGPLMLLLDPDGDAAGIVARWQHAADRFGWIVASTPAIMNGTPSDQDLQHLLALLEAVAAKRPVDRRAVILGGFSGGACAAYRHALERPDLFRGAIVECGHMGPFRDLQDQIRSGSIFFLATRIHDFNAPAMRTLAKAFEDRGEQVKIIELPGGHEPLTGGDTDEALEWIDALIR